MTSVRTLILCHDYACTNSLLNKIIDTPLWTVQKSWDNNCCTCDWLMEMLHMPFACMKQFSIEWGDRWKDEHNYQDKWASAHSGRECSMGTAMVGEMCSFGVIMTSGNSCHKNNCITAKPITILNPKLHLIKTMRPGIPRIQYVSLRIWFLYKEEHACRIYNKVLY